MSSFFAASLEISSKFSNSTTCSLSEELFANCSNKKCLSFLEISLSTNDKNNSFVFSILSSGISKLFSTIKSSKKVLRLLGSFNLSASWK